MAPEIIAGRTYGQSTDMWSVGVVLYILLSGKVPFVGKPAEVLRQISGGEYSVGVFKNIFSEFSNLYKEFDCFFIRK